MSEQNNSNSSIIASFQFVNYKVESFKFNIQNKKVDNIIKNFDGSENWSVSIGIRKPILYKKSLSIIGGLKVLLLQHDKAIEEKQKNETNSIMSLECSLVGLFKMIDSVDFETNKSVYEDLCKYQIPAILSPYIRATITSYFANAGFGSFIFPLINFTKVAYEQKVELEILDK